VPAGASTTPTTTLSLPNRTLITENRVLSSELGLAIGRLQKLEANGTKPSGLKVLSVASKKEAVKLNTSPPALANFWLRTLLGLLVGLVLGILATWLADAFDRRLRTSKRAEESFGLPVVAEIPSSAPTVSVIPVVDLVVDPYSPVSEAYRRLHVAVLTVPTVTWVRRGGPSYQDDVWEMPPMPAPPQQVPVAAGARVTSTGPAEPLGPEDPTGPVRLPVAPGAPAPSAARRDRFSILVTSPTDEPSRSLVVVNLAAVFAEAGDRVLVATTGGMRTNTERIPSLPPPWEDPGADLSASELVANARPSQIPGVSSLSLGQLFANPSRLALKAGGLVEAARDVVDVVILEAPLLSTQDGAALLPVVDLVLVVCEAWRTTVSEGIRTQRMLAQRRSPVLGLVMTNVETRHPIMDALQTRA
jgi:Mrp family chromosome partitioning ATPase